MADKAAFTAWLGVVVDPGTGVKYQLSGTLKTLLIALYDAGSIDVDDVYLPSCVIKDESMKDAVAVWEGYLVDAVAAAKGTSSSADKRKLEQWLRARFGEQDVAAKDESKDVAPSAAALEDMKEQGASELWQLGFIELAFATGRFPARKETNGYAYKAPWTSMDGGKFAVKFKEETVVTIMDKAMPTCDVKQLDTFFVDLSNALTQDKGDALAVETSSRVSQFWQAARSLKEPSTIFDYVVAYRKRYKGRGLPKIRDEGLMMEAMAGYMSAGAPRSGTNSDASSSSSWASRHPRCEPSDDASSIGPSASAVGSSASGFSRADTARLEEQLNSVLSAVAKTSSDVSGLSSAVGSVKAGLDSLSSRVRAMESDGPKRQPCSKCGSTDHFRRDCPVLKKEQEAAKKE